MIRQSEAEALPLSPAEHWKPTMYVAKATRFYCSIGYDMLNVDISHDGVVVARYFADPVEQEYKGFLIGKRWKRIKLKNLVQMAAGLPPKLKSESYYSGWCEEAEWTWEPSSTSEGIIGGVLNMGVDLWENGIESRRYYSRARTKYEKLQERIGALLKPAPDGFEEWVVGLLHEENAVLKKAILDDYVYQCTECRAVWAKRKYKYREKRKITCPHCGKELIVKNRKETERIGIYLFQTCNDGTDRWYERYILCRKEWDPDKSEWQTILKDMNLAVIKSGERYGKLYYREGAGYSETSYNGQLPRMGKGYIFPDFGGAENLMSDHQKYCLRELAARGFEVNANKVIISQDTPELEYLLKGRYDRLAMEIIEDRWTVARLNYQATNLPDFLWINKQRCLRLRQINGGSIALEWLRYEEVMGRKVSAEAMSFFMKHNINPNDTYSGTRTMLSKIPSPTAFKNYIEKQAKLSGDTILQTISTYNDYYSMAEVQGLNMENEMFYKPKHLKAAHDECVRVAHEKEYEKRAAEIIKKFPDVPKILKDIRGKYSYEGETFTIIVPEKVEDIIAEGRALGHCIDTSDRYFDRIQKHVTYLVFLRRSASRTASWYTLEIEPNGTVRQQRTTGNNQNKADTEEYMPFIREWQRVVKQRMSEEDRKNAELSRQIRIEEYKELREKKEPVRSGLLAGKLLVDVLEADLVEAI